MPIRRSANRQSTNEGQGFLASLGTQNDREATQQVTTFLDHFLTQHNATLKKKRLEALASWIKKQREQDATNSGCERLVQRTSSRPEEEEEQEEEESENGDEGQLQEEQQRPSLPQPLRRPRGRPPQRVTLLQGQEQRADKRPVRKQPEQKQERVSHRLQQRLRLRRVEEELEEAQPSSSNKDDNGERQGSKDKEDGRPEDISNDQEDIVSENQVPGEEDTGSQESSSEEERSGLHDSPHKDGDVGTPDTPNDEEISEFPDTLHKDGNIAIPDTLMGEETTQLPDTTNNEEITEFPDPLHKTGDFRPSDAPNDEEISRLHDQSHNDDTPPGEESARLRESSHNEEHNNNQDTVILSLLDAEGARPSGPSSAEEDSRLTVSSNDGIRETTSPSTPDDDLVATSTQASSQPPLTVEKTSTYRLQQNLFQPLRLTAASDREPLPAHTIDSICKLHGISSLTETKKQELIVFLESLFSPVAYWELRNTMIKVVSKRGICNIAREYDGNNSSNGNGNIEPPHRTLTGKPNTNRGDEHKGTEDLLPEKTPACIEDFVQRWRITLTFAQETATPTTARMTSQLHEMKCYIYWHRLLQYWRNSRGGAGNDIYNSNRPGQEDRRDLHIFLLLQLERRSSELGASYFSFSQPESTSTENFIKALLAPYLGFRIPLSLFHGQGDRGSDIARESSTKRMFDEQWNYTMTRGKIWNTLCESLGWGALVFAKSGRLRTLGADVLIRVVPFLVKQHPSLKTILDKIYSIFLRPLQSGQQLLYHDVGIFLRLGKPEILRSVCANTRNGLMSVFEGDGPFEPEDNGDAESAQEAANLGGEEEEQPDGDVFATVALLAEEAETDKATRRRARRKVPALPTPPTTGSKRRAPGPNSDAQESPLKRIR
ncbi:MAG: hypothetical protein Q9167_004177 [Letrouitia subvulpina]